MGDYNTLAYLPHKDVVIPPFLCGDVNFLEIFGTPLSVKPSKDRKHTVFFAGEVENFVGKAARYAIMSGTLFPRLQNKVHLKAVRNGMEYARFLNDSIFCLHIFGAAGWSARLSETIYAGCIPVLTSDVTHPPFSDVLNWAKFSYFVDWRDLEQLEEVLMSIAPQEIKEKQESLLLVREAFMYDPSPAAYRQEFSGSRKGPVFLTLLTLKMRMLTFFPNASI
jgi:xylogalacturonan beta-1,3-xylosyltransferase